MAAPGQQANMEDSITCHKDTEDVVLQDAPSPTAAASPKPKKWGAVKKAVDAGSDKLFDEDQRVKLYGAEGEKDLAGGNDKFWNVVTAAASGSILRARADERGKAFMAVPDTKCGFAAVHQGDEVDMLKGLGLVDEKKLLDGDEETKRRNLEESLLSAASDCCGFVLDEIICPTPDQTLGFYEVVEVKKWCQKEFSYPATDFTVYPQDVSTKVGECLHPMTDPAHPKEGECKEHACGSGNVVHSFKIMSKNVNFRCSPLGGCFGCLPGDVVYHLTTSANGIARFHLSPDRGTFAQLLFAYGDSEGCCCCCCGPACSCCANIKHALTHGCFCLGVWFKEKLPEGSDKTARVVLMRYNRWNDDELHPYWGGIVHPFKKKANGEWDQDHCEDMDHLK